LYLTLRVAPGWGLLGLYLIAVNAAVHAVAFLVKRRYNPGLLTAIVLFVPLSILTFRRSAAMHATWIHHAVALAAALAIHAALVVQTRRRAERLRRAVV
jgi:hypothetical protein